MKSKDLNLLPVVEALLLERNVSKAARRLGLSQPALSHALAKLRRDFDDDLFVRSGKGVTPTARALALAPDVTDAVARLHRLFAGGEAFDARKAEARVVIATTDYLETLLLPRLLSLFRKDAPGIVPVVRPAAGALPKGELEAGTVDLAIAGFFGDLPEGFYKQTLIEETYTCIVRTGHPRVKGKLTLADYVALDHILVSPQGDLSGAVDKALAKKKLKRRVVAGVATFHTPGAIVATSDCIATLPSRIAANTARHYPVRCFPPPLDVPGFRLVQVWHARTHRDPVQAWVRRAIEAALQEGTG